jgi:hypothetical protein
MDMKIYYNVKESISSARKVFRLFRFFDEIKGLVKILKTDRPIAFKILSFFTYMCSISYYISDNTLWLLNIIIKSGGLDKRFGKFWKHKKNILSLSRVAAYTIILIYSVVLQKN